MQLLEQTAAGTFSHADNTVQLACATCHILTCIFDAWSALCPSMCSSFGNDTLFFLALTFPPSSMHATATAAITNAAAITVTL
jgi:hypothetical protein